MRARLYAWTHVANGLEARVHTRIRRFYSDRDITERLLSWGLEQDATKIKVLGSTSLRLMGEGVWGLRPGRGGGSRVYCSDREGGLGIAVQLRTGAGVYARTPQTPVRGRTSPRMCDLLEPLPRQRRLPSDVLIACFGAKVPGDSDGLVRGVQQTRLPTNPPALCQ